MWCNNCQADVAAETSADNRFLHCATCRTTLKALQSDELGMDSSRDRTRDARQLLERWSTDSMLDPYGPRLKMKLDTSERDAPLRSGSKSTLPPPPELSSFDTPIEKPEPATPEPPQAKTEEIPSSEPSAQDQSEEYNQEIVEESEQEQESVPTPAAVEEPAVSELPRFDTHHVHGHAHIAVPPPVANPQRESSSHWLTWTGQFLAYIGVLGLTLGSCLILWSHFGGPANYAPTGWLITTASQMLLFLGIITLVSGGLEQVSQVLTRRMDRLGDRILRFEQADRQAAGLPPLPARRRQTKTTPS